MMYSPPRQTQPPPQARPMPGQGFVPPQQIQPPPQVRPMPGQVPRQIQPPPQMGQMGGGGWNIPGQPQRMPLQGYPAMQNALGLHNSMSQRPTLTNALNSFAGMPRP